MTSRSAVPILIVDDDPSLRTGLRQWMRLAGFETIETADAGEGLRHVSPEFPGCIVSDVRLPGDDGMAFLKKVKAIDGDLPVVLITGHGDVPMAVAAMRGGADDFIEKPFDPDLLTAVVRRAVDRRRLVLENRSLSRRLADADGLAARLIGESPAMQRLRNQVQHFATADAPVMVIGETGTGKEVVAKALHGLSARKDDPFVAVNCAALPETMVEAELFGHEAGAFTGAERARTGRVEQANKGVLFLDEIVSMPLSLQPKLLRVLQEREVDRLGGTKPVPVDIRVIAATNIEPRRAVAERLLREDLLFRLNAVEIRVPPLRDRGNDVHLLFDTFVNRFAADYRVERPRLTVEDEAFLFAYEWPGNVRELRNAAERFVLNAALGGTSLKALTTGEPIATNSGPRLTLKEIMDAYERSVIAGALRRHAGRISEVMTELGVPRRTLNEKMTRLGLSRAEADVSGD